MNYDQGLNRLEALIQPDNDEARKDFALYKGQLKVTLREERRYGGTERTRADLSRIIDNLNDLAYATANLSFGNLCQPRAPASPTRSVTASDLDILAALLASHAAWRQPNVQELISRAKLPTRARAGGAARGYRSTRGGQMGGLAGRQSKLAGSDHARQHPDSIA